MIKYVRKFYLVENIFVKIFVVIYLSNNMNVKLFVIKILIVVIINVIFNVIKENVNHVILKTKDIYFVIVD